MKKQIRKDYAIVGSIILLISLVVIISYIQTLGYQKVTQQIIRFVLTAILVIFTVLDKSWAKWTLSILSLLGGLFGLVQSLALFSENMTGALYILAMSIFYLFTGIYIITTENKIKR